MENFSSEQQYHVVQLGTAYRLGGVRLVFQLTGKLGRAWVGAWVGAQHGAQHGAWVVGVVMMWWGWEKMQWCTTCA